MTEPRRRKMEDAIRDLVMNMIMREEIKDYRVGRDLDVARVKVSSDLSQAKIYVSSYKETRILANAVEGLNTASGFIRSALGRTLRTRNTPKPVFFVDESLREEFALGKLIERAVREDSER